VSDPKPNRASGTIWPLRDGFTDYVRTLPSDQVRLYVNGLFIDLDRPTARLLAKRLNQCLDRTAKR